MGNSLNVNKCHILHVGTRNQKFDYEINGVKLESVQCVKDLDVSIASKPKFSKQCKNAAELYKHEFLLQGERYNSTTVLQFNQTPPGICRAILVAPPYRGHSKISCPVKGYEDDYISM